MMAGRCGYPIRGIGECFREATILGVELGGTSMDERRFRELEEKRDSVGLTSDEANELGRMMATRECGEL